MKPVKLIGKLAYRVWPCNMEGTSVEYGEGYIGISTTQTMVDPVLPPLRNFNIFMRRAVLAQIQNSSD